MNILEYFDKDSFWKAVNRQAASNLEGRITDEEPILLLNENHPKYSHKKIYSLVKEGLEYCRSNGISNTRIRTMDDFVKNIDNTIDDLRKERLIERIQNIFLDMILGLNGPPATGYHISGMDASEFDNIELSSFVQYSSASGAMTPGVYSSPYADILYAGGDQLQKHVVTPVILEFSLDDNCDIYTVRHSSVNYMPIEISTRLRAVQDFKGKRLIEMPTNDIHIALRGKMPSYKQALLVYGGVIEERQTRHTIQDNRLV